MSEEVNEPENVEPRKFAKKYDTVEGLESAYEGLQKKLSSELRVPDSGASPEDWASFYSKLGRPETPHGYLMPENTREREALDPMSKVAHEQGLTKEQWEALSGVAKSQLVKDTEKDAAKIEKMREEWQTSAKLRYGENLDEKLAQAKRTLDGLVHENPDINSVLTKTGLVDHPAILDLMIQTGEKMSDDKSPDQAVSTPGGDNIEAIVNEGLKLVAKGSPLNPRHEDYRPDYKRFMEIQQILMDNGYEGLTDPRFRV